MSYPSNKKIFSSKLLKVFYNYDDNQLEIFIYPLGRYYPNIWIMIWLWGMGFVWSGKKEYWIIKGFGKGW